MHAEDPKYDWGYDDCVFYERAFDRLEEQACSDPSLVYLDVSMHHWPFDGVSDARRAIVFPKPRNYLERYVNSARKQDVCLSHFIERYRRRWAQTATFSSWATTAGQSASRAVM